MVAARAALSYHEPDVVTIIILSSFLLLCNAINYLLDRILYCGLIGQILIGVAYGAPGARWLTTEVQQVIMQLGYIGLVMIVYEGGLSTNLATMRANLGLSAFVAIIGIFTPIALSFILRLMMDIAPLAAFAAGAALCSTSLGTTFTVLATTGLQESRLGIVLSSAAMMDDVVGLVMVQIISSLGQRSSVKAIAIVRPILVSIAFAVVVPLACRFIIKPLTLRVVESSRLKKKELLHCVLSSPHTWLTLQTSLLLSLVVSSSFAGMSNLFAAYLAGVIITWLSNLGQTVNKNKTSAASSSTRTADERAEGNGVGQISQQEGSMPEKITQELPVDHQSDRKETDPDTCPFLSCSGGAIYDRYYATVVSAILKPFFFASIGFSIPITQMFKGSIVWRGIVYAALMTVGKLVCGVCLIRLAVPSRPMASLQETMAKLLRNCWSGSESEEARNPPCTGPACQSGQLREEPVDPATQSKTQSRLPKPRSLYPAAILGSAMVTRGEIGFLISAIAESKGVFSSGSSPLSESSRVFLVVTWAISICTIIGPITVGVLVKRVKRLQSQERSKETGKEDPLDIWGFTNKSEAPASSPSELETAAPNTESS